MGTITLNEKQRRRCEIITRLIANKISTSEASELLGRSSRQVRRIRQRYEAQGLETLVHGNQGRLSSRHTPPVLIEQLRELAGPTGRYHDFNVSHLAELLARDEGIKLPRSTLSRLLIAHHIRPPRCSKTRVKRMQRERKSAEGMMLQTDVRHTIGWKAALQRWIYSGRSTMRAARWSTLASAPAKISLAIC